MLTEESTIIEEPTVRTEATPESKKMYCLDRHAYHDKLQQVYKSIGYFESLSVEHHRIDTPHGAIFQQVYRGIILSQIVYRYGDIPVYLIR